MQIIKANEEMTENEKKKEFLQSYRRAKRKVERLERQLRELRLNKLSPSAINGDGMPHSTDIADLSDYAAKLDEIERDIISARYERICAFQRVQKAIEMMADEQEKNLLTYRYIDGVEWEIIAVEMKYTWRHTLRLHGRALENFKMS